MKTNQYEKLHSLMSSQIDELADKCLQIASDHLDSEYQYTEADAMNVLVIFSHVLSNISNHDSIKEEFSVRKGSAKAELYGKELRTLFMNMTGIDPHIYCKNSS